MLNILVATLTLVGAAEEAPEIAGVDPVAQLAVELLREDVRLAVMRKRYMPDHPELRFQELRVKRFELALTKLDVTPRQGGGIVAAQLRAALAVAEAELEIIAQRYTALNPQVRLRQDDLAALRAVAKVYGMNDAGEKKAKPAGK